MRQPLTPQWSLGRPILLLGLAFILGTGIGWVVTRPFAGASSSQVSSADYVAVVAQLFQRDHNEEIARERLALLGSPTMLVQRAVQDAQSGKVKDQSDRTAVEALAQALAPSAANGVRPSATAVSSTASTAPSASTAANPTPVASSGRTSLLGPIVAFALAFLLGIVVLLRTAGLSLPLARVFRTKIAQDKLPGRDVRSRPDVATLRTGSPPLRQPRQASGANSASLGRLIDATDDEDPDQEPVPVRSAGRVAPRTTRSASYQSSYRLGDEPFDEIHPITDPATGTLVAACGLSSALKLSSSTAQHYYAFTAWVQDYLSGEQLRAVGFVTRWALHAEGRQIDEWVRQGQVEEVVPVQHGVSTVLKTDTLTTEVTVLDVGHGLGGAADDHVTRLTVRFDVHWDEAEDDER